MVTFYEYKCKGCGISQGQTKKEWNELVSATTQLKTQMLL